MRLGSGLSALVRAEPPVGAKNGFDRFKFFTNNPRVVGVINVERALGKDIYTFIANPYIDESLVKAGLKALYDLLKTYQDLNLDPVS